MHSSHTQTHHLEHLSQTNPEDVTTAELRLAALELDLLAERAGNGQATANAMAILRSTHPIIAGQGLHMYAQPETREVFGIEPLGGN